MCINFLSCYGVLIQ